MADDRIPGLPPKVALLLPVALLALVGAAFVVADPLADFGREGPPSVDVTNHRLPRDRIILSVTNNGPQPVTIEQVLVDEAYWNFHVVQDGERNPTLGARDSAKVHVPYHWQSGWDVEVALLLSDGTTVHHDIPAPAQSPVFGEELSQGLALVGLVVGVIPVALGMLWYPALERASDQVLHGTLAFAGGVLAFLAADGFIEAGEIAEGVAGYVGGDLLVAVGVLGSLLVIQAVSTWTRERAGAQHRGLVVAYLVALGIGLHNLGEGLAIGSAYAQGRASFGAFLVLGFAVHNLTEGPAIVAPVARGKRPRLKHFVALAGLAGGPVIVGGWVGGVAYSSVLGALALAVGIGAILQVEWELAGLVRESAGEVATAANLAAFAAGLLVMYATDLFVVL